jgi:hypothetical protein
MIEEVTMSRRKLVLTFIDFKKAFDSVKRSRMFKVLKLYGVPDLMIQQMKAMYQKTTAKVRTADGLSDQFNISTGVLQGDTLAPYLFVIVIDYIMSCAQMECNVPFVMKKGTRHGRVPNIEISDLDYADDIVLMADTIEDSQDFLNAVTKHAAQLGLMVNIPKTEYMVINGDGNDGQKHILVNDVAIKKVKDFKYLGAWIFSTEKDIEVRIGSSWGTVLSLKKIWKSSDVSEQTKIHLFRTLVEAVLLYGSETWTLTKGLEQRLNSNYTKMIRCILGIRYTEHVSNDALFNRTKLRPISEFIQFRQHRFAGHCMRAKDQPVSDILTWQAQRRRGFGNKKTLPQLLVERIKIKGQYNMTVKNSRRQQKTGRDGETYRLLFHD